MRRFDGWRRNSSDSKEEEEEDATRTKQIHFGTNTIHHPDTTTTNVSKKRCSPSPTTLMKSSPPYHPPHSPPATPAKSKLAKTTKNKKQGLEKEEGVVEDSGHPPRAAKKLEQWNGLKSAVYVLDWRHSFVGQLHVVGQGRFGDHTQSVMGTGWAFV